MISSLQQLQKHSDAFTQLSIKVRSLPCRSRKTWGRMFPARKGTEAETSAARAGSLGSRLEGAEETPPGVV